MKPVQTHDLPAASPGASPPATAEAHMPDTQSDQQLANHPAHDEAPPLLVEMVTPEFWYPPFGPGLILVFSGLRDERGEVIKAIFPPGAVLQRGPTARDVGTEGWRVVTWTYAQEDIADDGAVRQRVLGAPISPDQAHEVRLVDVMEAVTCGQPEHLDWVADIITNLIRGELLLGSEQDRSDLASELRACIYDVDGSTRKVPDELAEINPRLSRRELERFIEQLGYDCDTLTPRPRSGAAHV